ncbi:hypothetical protein CDAR_515351 [Caerostris darwini]|uniref:Uncharacterized protein n=1 Tax=Caerostris darwini TaxID=1538125 RepID=A0AAV4PQP1_9ARAC|nr:hypothetical protein CDAR_515351 [Caerostris darwini]
MTCNKIASSPNSAKCMLDCRFRNDSDVRNLEKPFSYLTSRYLVAIETQWEAIERSEINGRLLPSRMNLSLIWTTTADVAYFEGSLESIILHQTYEEDIHQSVV